MAVTTVRLDASGSTFRAPSELIVGPYQNCALFDHGGFGCWGYNGYGVLGLGHTSNRGTIVNHPTGRPIPSEEVRFWNGTRGGYHPFGDEVERFTIHPPLPTGLEFDTTSGSIHYDGAGPVTVSHTGRPHGWPIAQHQPHCEHRGPAAIVL